MATKEEMKATLVKLQAEVDNLKKQIEDIPTPDWVKEFLEGKWVVRCANETEAASFLTTCKDAGITWWTGRKITVEKDKNRNLFTVCVGGIQHGGSIMKECKEVNFADLTAPTPKNPKLTMEKFKEDMVTVECNTPDEAETFLTWCRDAGIKWAGNETITPKDYRHTNLFCMEDDPSGERLLYYDDDDYPRVNFTDVVPPVPSTDKIIEDYVKALGSMMTTMVLGGGLPKGKILSLSGPNPTRTFEEFGRGLFCVNCANETEAETFLTWCSHFDLTWNSGHKVTPDDDRIWNRFIMDRVPTRTGCEMRMFHTADPESPTVNFSDIIPPIENVKLTVADVHACDYIEVKVIIPPSLPKYTFEAFLNREVCVNFQTEEECRTFWDWCKNADVNWARKITEDRWEVFRTTQRWVVRPCDDRKYLCYDACDDVPEVQFTQIIPPVKPEPPKPTRPYTLEGFLNGEFCVNFDSNEERGILFDMLYDRLDWSRFIDPNRTYLRDLYGNRYDRRWCVERNVRKETKELFTQADEKDFPVEVKFKDMNLFSADIFGAGNVAVCFDQYDAYDENDTKKKDLLYFFAWCRKHGFHFKPSWEVMLNSTFIWTVGYIVMEDGFLRQGGNFPSWCSKYRRVNFSDIKPLLGEVVVHTMEDFKNRKFCIIFKGDADTTDNRKLIEYWCQTHGIRVDFYVTTEWTNRFVVTPDGKDLLHNALDNVPAVNFNEIKHLLGGM